MKKKIYISLKLIVSYLVPSFEPDFTGFWTLFHFRYEYSDTFLLSTNNGEKKDLIARSSRQDYWPRTSPGRISHIQQTEMTHHFLKLNKFYIGNYTRDWCLNSSTQKWNWPLMQAKFLVLVIWMNQPIKCRQLQFDWLKFSCSGISQSEQFNVGSCNLIGEEVMQKYNKLKNDILQEWLAWLLRNSSNFSKNSDICGSSSKSWKWLFTQSNTIRATWNENKNLSQWI